MQHTANSSAPRAVRDWDARWRPADAERLATQWQNFTKTRKSALRVTLAVALPNFAKNVQALAGAQSAVSRFEAAADAIAGGEAATLAKLLIEESDWVRARSTREHRSTLLHYVSANGIEDFRQKTPANIVEMTKLLLDAGADVNAESDAYRGRSTTLGLTATSCHPAEAGVQLPLIDLLTDHRGRIGNGAVVACLRNGRGEAAEHLANREARSIWRPPPESDVSLRSVPSNRRPRSRKFATVSTGPASSATPLSSQYSWNPDSASIRSSRMAGRPACTGPPMGDMRTRRSCYWSTPRRWAVRGESYDGTPLGWALYGWGAGRKPAGKGDYYEAVAHLIRAGAKVESGVVRRR